MKKLLNLVIFFAFLAASSGQTPQLSTPGTVQVVQTVSELINALAAAQGAPEPRTVALAAGEYRLDQGLLLENLRDFTLRSANESDPARITIAPSVGIAIELGDQLHNVAIEGLHLQGAGLLAHNTHAIGSHEGGLVIAGLRIERMQIDDVAVGISVGSCPGKQVQQVVIADNLLRNVVGNESGSGYGIHSACASEVRIARNRIERSQRHGIYVARGGPVVVLDNAVLEHGYRAAPKPYWRSAIVVARSQNIVVQGNRVVASADVALSVEHDPPEDATGVCVGSNLLEVSGAGKPALWVNVGPGTAVQLAGTAAAIGPRALRVSSGTVHRQAVPCALPAWATSP